MHTTMHTNLNEVQPGWDVIDRLGEKIGDVNKVQTDHLVLTKGLIFVKDLYVPLDAIEKVDTAAQTVTLNVRKGDIDETRWAQAPAASYRGEFAEGTSEDDPILTVKEERIRADKARKQTGEVAVGKRVVEQQEATLRRDAYRRDDDDLAGQAGGAAAGAIGGAAVGAAVGGPPGAVVGGAIGAAGGAAAGDAVEDEVEGDDPR